MTFSSYKEYDELIHKLASERNWKELSKYVNNEKLSDLYLRYCDNYYTIAKANKSRLLEYNYLTKMQLRTRKRKEYSFSNLSYKQLKQIEEKEIDIADLLREMEG